jgi:cytochrome bd-type quinol oxidase subunit 2
MSDLIPEIRTSRNVAIGLCVAALAALPVAVLFGHQLEDPLGSEAASIAVLAVWCLAGAGAAIAAIVDAYVRPDGELLGLITTIVATVFAVLALVVFVGIVVGATGVVETETPAEARAQPAARPS